jgi:hypothetical protein
MIKTYVNLIILITGISVNLYSQSSTARFLYWQPSAEITAMGGAGVSLTDNPFAAYYNPASFAFNNSFRLAGSFVKPFPGFENQYNSMISISQKFGHTGTFGLTFNFFWMPAQYRLGPDGPEPLGVTATPSFTSPTHFHIKASYSSMLTAKLSFGVSLGILSTTLDKSAIFEEAGGSKNTTVLADAGLLITDLFSEATFYNSNDYVSPLADQRTYKGVSAGISLLNFGPKMSFIQDGLQNDPPSTILLGINYWPVFTNIIGTRVLLDFEKRIYDSDKLDYIHLGNEILVLRMFSARFGYVIDNINSDQSYFTFGFGVKTKFFSLNVSHYKKVLLPAWHFDGNINLEF